MQYEQLEQVGEGAFGRVVKIRRKSDGQIFVWKEIYFGGMNDRERQMLVAEVNLMREFADHPNIVRYYDRIIDRSRKRIYIIMEHCGGGDLAAAIKLQRMQRRFFDEKFVWSVLEQVATALDVCHCRRGGSILHRDLKPGNVLLDSTCTHVKLADFGLAKVLSDETVCARSHVGTPSYMSPEQVRSDMYDAKSDIWSLGCLMYEMATLSPPFRAKNPLLLARKITEGKFSPLPEHYSFELRDLIASMLELQPRKRPSVETVLRLCEASPVSSSQLSSRSMSDMSEELEQRERSLSLREAELREMERRLHCDAKALKKRELALQARERSLQRRESGEFLTPTHSRPISASREPKLLQRLRCRLGSPTKEGESDLMPSSLQKKTPKREDKEDVGVSPNCQQESLAQHLLSRLTLTELRRDLDVAANRLDPRRRLEHRAGLRV